MMKLFGLKVFWLIESRRTGRAGHVTRKRGKRKAYRVLAGNPEGRRSFERPGHKCKFNIKVDVKENVIGVRGLDLTQNRESGGLF